MRDKIKLLTGVIAVVFMLSTALSPSAFASEGKTKAEMLQEMLGEGQMTFEEEPDIVVLPSESEVEEEPGLEEEDTAKTELELQWENLSAAQIVKGISQLDTEAPDIDKVKAIRKSYNKLPASEKVLVSNISTLTRLEELISTMGMSETGTDASSAVKNPNDPTSGSNVVGTSYTFEIEEEASNLSLIARFTTDDNNDGLGDIPSFKLMSPDGTITTLTNKMTDLQDNKSSIAFSWEQTFFQMDVAHAMPGNWTLSASIPVTFTKTGYRGNKSVLISKEEIESGKQPESDVPESEEAGESQSIPSRYISYTGYLLILFFILIIIVSLFLGRKFLFSSTPGLPGKGKKDKEPAQTRLKPMKEEDELELIRKELAEQKKKDEMMEEALRKKKEDDEPIAAKKKQEDDDERFYVSQQDIDDDDSIEEFTEVVSGESNNNDEGSQRENKSEPVRKTHSFGGRFG